jgi:tetratricopeptide (TPR) repeat protein
MNAKAEDLALRIKPAHRVGRFNLAWVSSKAAVIGVVFAAVVFLGVMSLWLRDSGSFARRKIEFPPLPQLNASIAAAQERLKGNPHDIATLVELGTLHFEKGKEFYPDAINELEDARELGALDPRIFYCLGIMYQEVGLYPYALDEYRRFLRHYPDDKEIRMLAAKLLYKQGEYTEAVSEYERLKFNFPNDGLIEENLGLSLWGAKAVERAIESFGLLKAQGGDQGKRAQFYLGQIAIDKGDFSGALGHLEQALIPAGSSGYGLPVERVYTALGTAYQKTNKLDEAKAAWERVVAAAPEDAKAKAALKEVVRLIGRRPAPKKQVAKS